MLAGVTSDVQSNYMSTINNDKTLQAPPELKTTKRDESYDKYEDFKNENANLFSVNSQNNTQVKH